MLNVVALGPWSPSQVIATAVPSSRPIVKAVEAEIEDTWRAHINRLGEALFDGPMSRLESWQTVNSKLLLNLSSTSYRIFLGTNLCRADLSRQFGRQTLANAVGMSVALRTDDGKLVMGRRNERVAYYPNRIHPFAGSLEPDDVPDVFAGIRRELSEELGLNADDLRNLKMLAIIEDQRLLQPEFIFSADTVRTSDQLPQTLDASEHEAIWICDASALSLTELLGKIDADGRCGSDQFTPVAVGTLLMFGRHFFGESWLDENGKRFID
ncbi:MAG TPA: NUDIX hydrolase [Tepidisphaeraceae bacterium]|nr:NUDIX hydrolase [Tepidisphaeraceae bacterium]